LEVQVMEGLPMDLDTIVHELVGIVMAQSNSRIVEMDDMVLALEHMFPDIPEARIAMSVVRDVEQRDGAIAWIGHA